MNRIVCCFILSIGSLFSLPPGISYQHLELEDPLSIHLLSIDPKYYTIQPARALNDGLGRETVLSIANRKGAIAAINGGFFLIQDNRDGQPKGILKIFQDWYADAHSKKRAAMGWNNAQSTPLFSRLETRWLLKTLTQEILIHGINRERQPKEVILYTFAYHRSTLAPKNGTEVLVQDGKVISVVKNGGDSPIPPNGFVLSSEDKIGNFKEGDKVFLQVDIIPLDETDKAIIHKWQKADFLLGGTPLLIHKGLAITDHSREQVKASFLDDKRARTAVGFTQKGTWVFVVVDGPDLPLSIGMTIKELTEFMLKQGCEEAINLDGGGSSTMVLQGEVLNHPLGDEDDPTQNKERPVSDAIIVLPRI